MITYQILSQHPIPLPFQFCYFFHAKFFPEDVEQELIQPVTKHLFYLEVKDKIENRNRSGHLSRDAAFIQPSWEAALQLAVLSAQIDFNDFGESDLEDETEQIVLTKRLLRLLPKYLSTHVPLSSDIAQRLRECYTNNRGLNREEAEIRYLKIAQAYRLFGVDYFAVTCVRMRNPRSMSLTRYFTKAEFYSWRNLDRHPELVWLGITAAGIQLFSKDHLDRARYTFPWNIIKNVSYRERKFTVKLNTSWRPTKKSRSVVSGRLGSVKAAQGVAGGLAGLSLVGITPRVHSASRAPSLPGTPVSTKKSVGGSTAPSKYLTATTPPYLHPVRRRSRDQPSPSPGGTDATDILKPGSQTIIAETAGSSQQRETASGIHGTPSFPRSLASGSQVGGEPAVCGSSSTTAVATGVEAGSGHSRSATVIEMWLTEPYQAKNIILLCAGNHSLFMRRRQPDSVEVQQMRAQAREERARRETDRIRLERARSEKAAALKMSAALETRCAQLESALRSRALSHRTSPTNPTTERRFHNQELEIVAGSGENEEDELQEATRRREGRNDAPVPTQSVPIIPEVIPKSPTALPRAGIATTSTTSASFRPPCLPSRPLLVTQSFENLPRSIYGRPAPSLPPAAPRSNNLRHSLRPTDWQQPGPETLAPAFVYGQPMSQRSLYGGQPPFCQQPTHPAGTTAFPPERRTVGGRLFNGYSYPCELNNLASGGATALDVPVSPPVPPHYTPAVPSTQRFFSEAELREAGAPADRLQDSKPYSSASTSALPKPSQFYRSMGYLAAPTAAFHGSTPYMTPAPLWPGSANFQIPYWAACMNYPYMMMPSYHTSAAPSLGFPQVGLGLGTVTDPQAGLQAGSMTQGLPCAPVSMPVLTGGDDFYLTGGGETEEIPSGLMDYVNYPYPLKQTSQVQSCQQIPPPHYRQQKCQPQYNHWVTPTPPFGLDPGYQVAAAAAAANAAIQAQWRAMTLNPFWQSQLPYIPPGLPNYPVVPAMLPPCAGETGRLLHQQLTSASQRQQVGPAQTLHMEPQKVTRLQAPKVSTRSVFRGISLQDLPIRTRSDSETDAGDASTPGYMGAPYEGEINFEEHPGPSSPIILGSADAASAKAYTGTTRSGADGLNTYTVFSKAGWPVDQASGVRFYAHPEDVNLRKAIEQMHIDRQIWEDWASQTGAAVTVDQPEEALDDGTSRLPGPEYLQSTVGLEAVEQPLRSRLQNIYEASAAGKSMLLPPSPRKYKSVPPQPNSLQPESRDPCGPDGSSSVGYIGVDPTTQVFQPPTSISKTISTGEYESAVAHLVFGGLPQPAYPSIRPTSVEAADSHSSAPKPRDTIAAGNRPDRQHSGSLDELNSLTRVSRPTVPSYISNNHVYANMTFVDGEMVPLIGRPFLSSANDPAMSTASPRSRPALPLPFRVTPFPPTLATNFPATASGSASSQLPPAHNYRPLKKYHSTQTVWLSPSRGIRESGATSAAAEPSPENPIKTTEVRLLPKCVIFQDPVRTEDSRQPEVRASPPQEY
ncbi:hypothetical protein AAHC03_013284 [Spirometra sp. Aus1]